ncbi:MAG: peptidylprolyl isomerase [Planctomycetota bacterium]|jgi:peptidyl-prolyl cis-trans isomerase C
MRAFSFGLPALLSVVIWSAACGLAAGADTDATKSQTTDKPVPNSGGVAVTVNGVDITEAAVDAEVIQQLGRSRMPAQLPPQFIEQYKKQIRQQVVDKMIVQRLLDEQVKAAGIVLTDADVIAHLKESGSRQKPPLSLEDIKALIEAQGRSFEDVKKQIRESEGMRYKKLMEGQWAGKIKVTEDDAKKYYSENKKQFETPEQVRASHILITGDTTDPNTDPNGAKAKAKAAGLLKQIKAGADFATLAKANSAHAPSAARGGDLGFFARGQTVPPPLEKAAFELKVGQVSDVVETQYGYDIIKVTARKDAGTIPFEQARDNIIQRLTEQKQAELVGQYIESLKSKAKIVYPPGKEPKPVPPPVIGPPIGGPK